jgi:hypothetical protein
VGYNTWKTAPAVKRLLDDIREGRSEDKWELDGESMITDMGF